MVSTDDDRADALDDGPSRSQRKREAAALQDLGTRLLSLTAPQLAALRLPEALYDAVVHANSITSHEAKRRQVQYLGKLMRRHDITAITALFTEVDRQKALEKHHMRQVDHWLAGLLDPDQQSTTLDAVVMAHPTADREGLRKISRLAQREQQAASATAPPKFTRQLRRALHDLGTGPQELS